MSDLTQYKLFIGDEKKNTLFGVTFSFNGWMENSGPGCGVPGCGRDGMGKTRGLENTGSVLVFILQFEIS